MGTPVIFPFHFVESIVNNKQCFCALPDLGNPVFLQNLLNSLRRNCSSMYINTLCMLYCEEIMLVEVRPNK